MLYATLRRCPARARIHAVLPPAGRFARRWTSTRPENEQPQQEPAPLSDLVWASRGRFWDDAQTPPPKADRVYKLHWSVLPRLTASYLASGFDISDSDVSRGSAMAYKVLFEHYRQPGLKGDDRELRNILSPALLASVEQAMAERQLLDVHAETRDVRVLEVRRRAFVEADVVGEGAEPGSCATVAFVDGEDGAAKYMHVLARMGREDVNAVEAAYSAAAAPPVGPLMSVFSKIIKAERLKVHFEFDVLLVAFERFGLYRAGSTDLVAGTEKFAHERRVMRLETQPTPPPDEEGHEEPRFRIAALRPAAAAGLDEEEDGGEGER